ncbi:MAG: hypothetical protein AAF569_07375 [Pseudomonadota bacterium]
MVLCTLLLSSCGFSFGDDKPSETKTSAPALSTPPVVNDRPGNALSQMQPAKGVNTNLFGEKLRSDDDRLDRLEGAVQNLRNDFDNMAPAITRLTSVEGDLQELITQLETLLEQEAATPAPAPVVQRPQPVPAQPPAMKPPTQLEPVASRPQPIPDPPDAPKPASAPPGQSVIGLRVGEHPDKTRIVMDATGQPTFSFDLDNAERIFIVELPGTSWSAATQKNFSSSPLLQSYRTDTLGSGGTRLIMQLKKDAEVTYSKVINGKQSGQKRIVIDLRSDNSGVATQ